MTITNKVTSDIDLASYMMFIKQNILSSINSHHLGTIQSFDPSNQSANVSLNYKKVFNGNIVEYGVLVDCPCIVMGGGGGYVSFPISIGDECLVLFNDVDMDHWIANGQMDVPDTTRLHSFSDAIVLVGLRSFARPIDDYDSSNVILHAKGSRLISLENEVTNLKTVLNGLIDAIDVYLTTGIVNIPVTGTPGNPSVGTATFAAGQAAFDAYKTTIAGLLK